MSPVECLIALSTFGSLSTEATCTSIKPVTENVARPTLGLHTADVARNVSRNVEWIILRQYCTVYPKPRLNVVMSVNLQVLLDDHIVKTMTMKGSPFVVPFEAELKEWESKLVSLTLTFFRFYLLTFFFIILVQLFQDSRFQRVFFCLLAFVT